MLARNIHFKDDAAKEIIEGINITADAVKSTLGPRGQNVFIEESAGRMIVTKDGVTVARNISFKDKLKDIGAQIVKDASERTNKEAGDGTTTAAILTQFLANEGFRYKETGFNAMEMQKGMDEALSQVELALKLIAKQVTTFDEKKAIALISSNDDEQIAQVVAETIDETGSDGVVTIEKWDQLGIKKEIVKGIKINNGFEHPLMINNYEKNCVDLQNPAVLLITDDIQTPAEIVSLLDKVIKKGNKQVVIISPEVSSDVIGFLLSNRANGTIIPLVVKAPSYGEFMKREMEDIAAVLNCKLIGKEYGVTLNDIGKIDSAYKAEDFIGTCSKIVSSMTDTIISGAGGDIEGRIQLIRDQLKNTEDLFTIEKLKDRIAKLSGGVAVIRVGGDNAKEQKEKHYRVEDALLATRAAVEEGIVPGGGIAYLYCYKNLNSNSQDRDFNAGFELVKKCLLQSIEQLCKLSNISHQLLIEKINENGKTADYGYNFRTECYGNLFDEKVIDPVKVSRLALRYAIASTKLFLTNSVVITVDDAEKEKV